VTTSAARVRTISIVLVLGFLLVTHLLAPEPGERAELQYRIVIAIGWGHLLAALGRRRRRGPHDWRAWALGLSVSSWLFALYAALLEQWPGWVVVALAISTWHTVENDRARGCAPTHGLALQPLPRSLREHLLPLGATAFVGLLVLGTQDGSALLAMGGALAAAWPMAARVVCFATGLALHRTPGASRAVSWLLMIGPLLPGAWWSGWLGLVDLFVIVTLHHLLTWLLLALERLRVLARQGGRAAAGPLLRWLLVTHLPPMLLCGVLAVVPAPALDPLRTLVLAPGVYLFWSVLHVGQTAWARGLEAPGPSRAGRLRARW
jgi:hypothetical protein